MCMHALLESPPGNPEGDEIRFERQAVAITLICEWMKNVEHYLKAAVTPPSK